MSFHARFTVKQYLHLKDAHPLHLNSNALNLHLIKFNVGRQHTQYK